MFRFRDTDAGNAMATLLKRDWSTELTSLADAGRADRFQLNSGAFAQLPYQLISDMRIFFFDQFQSLFLHFLTICVQVYRLNLISLCLSNKLVQLCVHWKLK